MRLCLPLLFLAAAAGCYRSSGVTFPRQTPIGPAPRLAWVDNGFETTRVPAVSVDGTFILLGIADDDGGRGNPNYRFELRDRRDATLATHTVLTADEADTLFDAGGMTDELKQRIAAANRWLEEQHAARPTEPLPQLALEPAEEIASTFRATGGGGLVVEWRENQLTITHGGKPLVQRPTPATWLAPERPMPGGTETCHNPAFLGAAAVSPEHRVALLRIEYGGTDTCWEPNDAHRVVAW